MLIQNSRGFWTRLFSSIFKIYLIFWPNSMYSRHVYGSNIPLKYTVMLLYQQLYLRNDFQCFGHAYFRKYSSHAYFQTGAYYRASTVFIKFVRIVKFVKIVKVIPILLDSWHFVFLVSFVMSFLKGLQRSWNSYCFSNIIIFFFLFPFFNLCFFTLF